MAVEEFIQIELSIPNNKDLLNELEVMVREGELFLSPSDKQLTDKTLSFGLIYGVCTCLELKCAIHDEIRLILTFKPLFYENFNVWQACIECSIPLSYNICYDRQGLVSHIQLVKGNE